MSVIEASSVRCQTMADGTLRVTMDIEPRNAQDAFALFAAPGTPMALAALKTARVDKPKAMIGQYCFQAIDLCRDARFWEWIAFATLQGQVLTSEAEAAKYIKAQCGIDSRKELDSNDEARAYFTHNLFRPFNDWLATKRAA